MLPDSRPADLVFKPAMEYIKQKWNEYVETLSLDSCIILLNTSFDEGDYWVKEHFISRLEDEYSKVSQEFIDRFGGTKLFKSVCQKYYNYQGAKPVFYLMDNISNSFTSVHGAAELKGMRMFVVIIANKFDEKFPSLFYNNTVEVDFCLGEREYESFASEMAPSESIRAERTLRSLFPLAECTFFNKALLLGKFVGDEFERRYTSQWKDIFLSILDAFNRIYERNLDNAGPLVLEAFLNQATALKTTLDGRDLGNIFELLSSDNFCIDRPLLPTYLGSKKSTFQLKRLHLLSENHLRGSTTITSSRVDWCLIVTESCLYATYLATWSLLSNKPIREYLFGMGGIGKSFVLLFTAIYLKTCGKDKAIVVYIPDADSFIPSVTSSKNVDSSQVGALIAEHVFAFSGHDLAVEISAQMIPPGAEPAKDHLRRVLDVIGTFVEKKGLRVFFIVDQVTYLLLSFLCITLYI